MLGRGCNNGADCNNGGERGPSQSLISVAHNSRHHRHHARARVRARYQFHDRVDGELDGMRKDLHEVAKEVDLSRVRAKKKVATKKRAMLKR